MKITLDNKPEVKLGRRLTFEAAHQYDAILKALESCKADECVKIEHDTYTFTKRFYYRILAYFKRTGLDNKYGASLTKTHGLYVYVR